MPVPVSQTGAHVHISEQRNAVLASEGPFERAARMRAEREPAEAAGAAPQPQLPTASQTPCQSAPCQPERIQGDAVIDVKGLNFSYPGLGARLLLLHHLQA